MRAKSATPWLARLRSLLGLNCARRIQQLPVPRGQPPPHDTQAGRGSATRRDDLIVVSSRRCGASDAGCAERDEPVAQPQIR